MKKTPTVIHLKPKQWWKFWRYRKLKEGTHYSLDDRNKIAFKKPPQRQDFIFIEYCSCGKEATP